MVLIPALVVASIAFSLSPGAEAAVIPLPLQPGSQRPMMREKSFVSPRTQKRSPGLKVSPNYDEDHSQHWNYHHGYVNKDGHGHGPPHRRSELSKRNFAAGALIDVDIAMEKRDYQRKTSRPVQHKESHGAKHPAHQPLVKVVAEVEKRHHHGDHWRHGDHWDGDHVHVHNHKRDEIESRAPHDHDHYHSGHRHGGYYDRHGHWYHDKRELESSAIEERDSAIEARSPDHYHGHEHGHHHHHWAAREAGDHKRDARKKKADGKKGGKGGKKAHSFGTKKDSKKSDKHSKGDKHSESKRSGSGQLATAGTPGFVEVASTFFNSTLSRSIAGLVYSANPDTAPNATAFTLGTSTIQSTQFYLTAVDNNATDSSDYNTVNIRVPILNSQQLLTTDYCATFDLLPPSPLSLQPCGEVTGFSQNFAYNQTTSELQPLYSATPAPMALVDTSSGMQTKMNSPAKSFATDSNGTADDDSAGPDSADDSSAQSISLFFVPAAAYYAPPVPVQQLFADPSSTSTDATPSSTMDPMASTMPSSAPAASSTMMASSTVAAAAAPSSMPAADASMSSSDAPMPSGANTGAPPTPSGTTVNDGGDSVDSADPMAGISPGGSTAADASATPARRVMRW